jgi:hypothetical protein
MRTTLDIDEDVLAAASELAKRRNSTPGQVISQLVRKALTQNASPGGGAGSQGLLYRNGWYVLPSRGGLVTNEMIDKIQEELDREDARAAYESSDERAE